MGEERLGPRGSWVTRPAPRDPASAGWSRSSARAELDYLALLSADVEASSRIFEGMLRDWEMAGEAAGALRAAVTTGTRPSNVRLLSGGWN
jgi:hypothetical protein